MKSSKCARAWEIEAGRDGRLQGRARESAEEHAEACVECGRERRFMEQLGRQLREIEATRDDLALRRLRRETLEHADRVASGRPPRRPPKWLVPIIAIVAGLSATVWWPRAQPANTARPEAYLTVSTPGGTARWHRRQSEGRDVITLNEGTLRLLVRRRVEDPRVFVNVPDGIIEDVGTAFRVTVRNGRTVELAVEEGEIIFHRSGLSEVRVAAGHSFGPVDAVPSTTAQPIASLNVVPITGPHGSLANVAVAATSAPVSASVTPAEEDLSYLRVLGLLRDGKRVEARLAAKDYLDRFPNGFRRREVEQIAK